MNELISVIVPCFNAEQTLKRCIESLVEQSYQNWELLIIDDGSTDNSYQIAAEEAAKEPRIKVMRQQNAGVSEARNNGLAAAKGEFLAFLDADDWYSKELLESFHTAMLESGADIACCGYRLEMGERSHDVIEGQGDCYYQGEEFLQQIMFGNHIRGFVCNKMFRRELVKNVYFPKGIKLCEDLMFLCMLYQEDIKLTYLDRPLYHYWIGGTGATQNDAVTISKEGGLQVIDNYRMLEKYLPAHCGKRMVDRLCGESIINMLPMLHKFHKKCLYKQIKEVFFPFFFTDASIKNKIKLLHAVFVISVKGR